MTLDADTAREDLAFLKAIVAERPVNLQLAGLLYGSAGAIYGAQTLIVALALSGYAILGEATYWVSALAANMGYFALIAIVSLATRKRPRAKGTAGRALTAAFTGVGIANAVTAIGFALANLGGFSSGIWLLFPIIVCAFQGACWFVASFVIRQSWTWAVTIGWYLSAAGLPLLVGSIIPYMYALTAILFLLLGAPGYIMWRAGRNG
jgi:hypothetical protein